MGTLRSIQGNTKGFTIIEVMIVLVIAAVILLIVFLAVPALQRNSRNTQRRGDVNRLTTSFLEYLSVPNPIPIGNGSSNAALATQIKEEASANTFDTIAITWIIGAPSETATDDTANRALIKTRSVCNEAGTNIDGELSNGRVAILYFIETASGHSQQCVQIR